MVNSILYSEINIVCILILALLSMKVKNSVFLQAQRKLFFRVAFSNILFLGLDAVWIFVDNHVFSLAFSMNWILNSVYYILSGLLGLYWFSYSETIQESKFVRVKKYQIISWLPFILLTILTITSYKTGWLFYIDDQNTYHRGPAYVIQLMTSYGYVIFTAVKAFYHSFCVESYQEKRELRTLFVFVLPSLIAGTMQVWFPGFPILCIGNTFGILYVYITLQEQLISVDPLTKLNNRNQLYQYLSTKLTHLHESKDLYLLIMDIDYFKSINDQYGHVEGDTALKIVADCLMRSCNGRNYFLARYGGDEFIMICELDPNESIVRVSENIRQQVKERKTEYQLSISVGYTKYSKDIKNQQEFIAKADKELYKKKKSREK